MAENKNHSLVRRPANAVEKAAPGAKRILSGMVADTFALLSARIKSEAESWYENGVSCYVAQNYPEAVKWYRKAADQGHGKAQVNLGLCYANGQGVKKDYAEAYVWYNLAADTNEKAATARDALRTNMSPQQLREGERRYREFRSSKHQIK
jgi:tetratricopeptide (TPR) repeat protein